MQKAHHHACGHINGTAQRDAEMGKITANAPAGVQRLQSGSEAIAGALLIANLLMHPIEDQSHLPIIWR